MKRQVIGLALAAVLLGAGSAHALLIDNFSTTQTTISIGESTSPHKGSASNTTTISSFGAALRTMTLTVTSNNKNQGANVKIIPSDYLLSTGTGTTSTAVLDWKASTPQDLTDGGKSQFLVFGVDDLDQNLLVTVTLSDGTNTGSNTYLKVGDAVDAAHQPSGLSCTAGSNCPQIIGSISNNGFKNGTGGTGFFPIGNYFHGLDSFLGLPVTIDPATNQAFGGNIALDLTHITEITFSLTTAGNDLDFAVNCVFTSRRDGTGDETFKGVTYPTFNSNDAKYGGADSACASAVPEPASLILMGTGLLVGLVGMRIRSSRRQREV